MTIDRTRTLNGALAGATAAAVWWAQQRADMRVFGVPYDDAELLGTHAIDALAFQALAAGDTHQFCARRTAALVAHLGAFLKDRAALAPKDRDRPPLDAYFGEESA